MNEQGSLNVQVRKAKPEDAKAISELAKAVKLNLGNPRKDRGFLVYILDEEEYRERILGAKYFYVAEREGKILGFLVCYDDVSLKKLIDEGEFADEKKFMKFLSKQKIPFILGDQIAVDPDNTSKGVGKSLVDKLFEEMLEESITDFYGAILHKPIKNTASINFWEMLGCKLLLEVTNVDGLTWGIYKLGGEK